MESSRARRWLVLALALMAAGCSKAGPAPEPATVATGTSGAAGAPSPLDARAQSLARRFIIVDGHIDLPFRLKLSGGGGASGEDVSVRTALGDFDLPRAQQGGLDAPFMSIFIPPSYQASGGARALAEELIGLVEGLASAHPAAFALARTPDEVRRNSEAGKVSLPLGIENGAALEGKLENVAYFRGRGVSYITLTHALDNDLSDTSYDSARTHHGLSELGKQVVTEMNRVGILVDVSHVSDDAFLQAVELSQVPVIASHSSLRHFVPGFERNVSDEMLARLAARGGVMMVNFGSGFLRPDSNAVSQKRRLAAEAYVKDHGLDRKIPADEKRLDDYLDSTLPMPLASVEDVADHIDRIKRLVGVDHIGLGSDFDGVGRTLPTGLEDVSRYPNLLRVLLERGYTEAELEQICSGNVLRVWQRALDFAAAEGESAQPRSRG